MTPLTLVLPLINAPYYDSLSITFTEENLVDLLVRLPYTDDLSGGFYNVKDFTEVTSIVASNHSSGDELDLEIYAATIHLDDIDGVLRLEIIFTDIGNPNSTYLTDLITLNLPNYIMPAATKKRKVAKSLRDLEGEPTTNDFIAIASKHQTNSKYVKQVYQDISSGRYSYV